MGQRELVDTVQYQDRAGAVITPPAGTLGIQAIGGQLKQVNPDGTTQALGAGGGLATIKPNLVLGRSGGTIVEAGDSIIAGTGIVKLRLLQGLESIIKKRLRGSGLLGLVLPTFTNTAVAGQTIHDIWITNRTAQLLTPAADGNDVIVNGGINDVLGLAGIDAAGPWTLSQSMGFLQTGLDAFFVARPNSRLFYLSLLWGAGEAWALDSSGIPTGNNANDAGIRAMNTAIAQLLTNYPNARFIDLYGPMYQLSASRNPAKTATGILTTDGTHPGVIAGRAAGEIIASNVVQVEGQLPPTVVAPSRDDFSRGDWYEETWNWLNSMNTNGAPQAPPLTFNRWEKLSLSSGPGQVYAAGAADGNVQGGGIKYTPANVLQVSPTIFQAPKTTSWVLAFRAQFAAIGAGVKALFGLADSLLTAVPAGDGILVGIDQAFNGTQFVIESTRTGVGTTKSAGGAPVAADTNPHDFFLIFDTAAAAGVGIYNLIIDRVTVANLNPDANFPQTPQALSAGLCAAGGFVTVSRAMYAWIE